MFSSNVVLIILITFMLRHIASLFKMHTMSKISSGNNNFEQNHDLQCFTSKPNHGNFVSYWINLPGTLSWTPSPLDTTHTYLQLPFILMDVY